MRGEKNDDTPRIVIRTFIRTSPTIVEVVASPLTQMRRGKARAGFDRAASTTCVRLASAVHSPARNRIKGAITDTFGIELGAVTELSVGGAFAWHTRFSKYRRDQDDPRRRHGRERMERMYLEEATDEHCEHAMGVTMCDAKPDAGDAGSDANSSAHDQRMTAVTLSKLSSKIKSGFAREGRIRGSL